MVTVVELVVLGGDECVAGMRESNVLEDNRLYTMRSRHGLAMSSTGLFYTHLLGAMLFTLRVLVISRSPLRADLSCPMHLPKTPFP